MSEVSAGLTFGNEDEILWFSATGDHVEVCFPNLRTSKADADAVAPTMQIPIAQFESAMIGFIAQLHALRSTPADDTRTPLRGRFRLRCDKPVGDTGLRCIREPDHSGPHAIIPR